MELYEKKLDEALSGKKAVTEVAKNVMEEFETSLSKAMQYVEYGDSDQFKSDVYKEIINLIKKLD